MLTALIANWFKTLLVLITFAMTIFGFKILWHIIIMIIMFIENNISIHD